MILLVLKKYHICSEPSHWCRSGNPNFQVVKAKLGSWKIWSLFQGIESPGCPHSLSKKVVLFSLQILTQKLSFRFICRKALQYLGGNQKRKEEPQYFSRPKFHSRWRWPPLRLSLFCWVKNFQTICVFFMLMSSTSHHFPHFGSLNFFLILHFCFWLEFFWFYKWYLLCLSGCQHYLFQKI